MDPSAASGCRGSRKNATQQRRNSGTNNNNSNHTFISNRGSISATNSSNNNHGSISADNNNNNRNNGSISASNNNRINNNSGNSNASTSIINESTLNDSNYGGNDTSVQGENNSNIREKVTRTNGGNTGGNSNINNNVNGGQAMLTILEVIMIEGGITIREMEVITVVKEGEIVVHALDNNSRDQQVSSTHGWRWKNLENNQSNMIRARRNLNNGYSQPIANW